MDDRQSVSQMAATAQVAQALAHPVRLQILNLLRDEGAYVMHLTATLRRPQANISQHLSVLREAGLVMDEREGMTVIYRVRDPRVFDLIDRMKALSDETPNRRELHRPDRFAPTRGGRQCGCPRCAGK
jgi:DNA-binding transcriptional ArsR family regulator